MLAELKLKNIRLKEQKKLNEKNACLYKSIVTYIQSSSLREIEKEESLQQIMDMILQSQAENKSVELFMGKDYEAFCHSIIQEYSVDKSSSYKVLDGIQRYLIWMSVISLLMCLVNLIVNKSLSITVEQFIIVNYIAIFIIPIAKKFTQETASLSMYQRVLVHSKNDLKTLIVLGVAAISIILAKVILKGIFGEGIFYNNIGLRESRVYLMAIALIIVSIHGYKKIYSKR